MLCGSLSVFGGFSSFKGVSIYECTRWVLFEPNDEQLWARVVDTVRLFLRRQWRFGAPLVAPSRKPSLLLAIAPL